MNRCKDCDCEVYTPTCPECGGRPKAFYEEFRHMGLSCALILGLAGSFLPTVMWLVFLLGVLLDLWWDWCESEPKVAAGKAALYVAVFALLHGLFTPHPNADENYQLRQMRKIESRR